MKILHTSDWHLGRTFNSLPLADDQQAFLNWLVQLVDDRKVELVVIAGDVYDRAVAPNSAIQQFKAAVMGLRAAGAKVVAITGNHDGADRVASYGEMLDASGVYIRGGYAAMGEVIKLDFADGPDGQRVGLDIIPLPYLDPQLAPDDLDGADAKPSDAYEAFSRRQARDHHGVLEIAIAAAAPNRTAPRSVAIAHAFVGGATTSDSERNLSVGGTGQVSAALFESFSYTALGHLHRPQDVGGRPHLRYSGTPLAYSFSEEHEKSVTLLDMDANGKLTAIEHIPVPDFVGRPVLTITGILETLLAAKPTEKQQRAFVRAVVTDSGPVLDAKRKLTALYANVVEVKLEPLNDDGTPVVAAGAPENRGHLEPEALADMFWQDSTKRPATEAERKLLHAALDAAARNTAGKEA